MTEAFSNIKYYKAALCVETVSKQLRKYYEVTFVCRIAGINAAPFTDTLIPEVIKELELAADYLGYKLVKKDPDDE